MKRILLLLSLFAAAQFALAQLPNLTDFEIDPGDAFANLNQLEMAIGSSNQLDHQQLIAQLPGMALDSASEIFIDPLFKFNAFQFAAVVSCVASCASVGPLAGVGAVLYIHSSVEGPYRQSETKRAWLGCLAGNAPYVVGIAAYIAVLVVLNTQQGGF